MYPSVVLTHSMIFPPFFFRLVGAAALQKYIGSLGGIGTSGVGSSSSYAPKELNRDVMPEKVDRLYLNIADFLKSYHSSVKWLFCWPRGGWTVFPQQLVGR